MMIVSGWHLESDLLGTLNCGFNMVLLKGECVNEVFVFVLTKLSVAIVVH